MLDSRPGHPAAGRPPLHQMPRDQAEALAAAAGGAQLGHEPLHLLLQGRGDVDHHQEPGVLHRQRDATAALDQGQHSAPQLGPGHWQQSAPLGGDEKRL